VLFVSDAAAGRVMPVDIIDRRVGRPIEAGPSPGAMRFDANDPGEKASLLLVVSQGSSDLSVIRIRSNAHMLLTMIPLGDVPRELAVKLF